MQAGGHRFESDYLHHPVTMLIISKLRGFLIAYIVPLLFKKRVAKMGAFGYIWVHMGAFRCKFLRK